MHHDIKIKLYPKQDKRFIVGVLGIFVLQKLNLENNIGLCYTDYRQKRPQKIQADY